MSNAKEEKKKVAENIWLNYYNDYLFQMGVIDEKHRNKMRLKIMEQQAGKSREKRL